MKIIRVIIFIAAICFIPATIAFARTDASIWAVDFVKTKDGQQENYLKFIENNWAKARAFMKTRGIVRSYQVLLRPASQVNSEWDVLLITEYSDQPGYEKREAVFNEYRQTVPSNSTDNANRINPREIAEIKINRTFNRPITSELGEMMLAAQTADAETAAAHIPLENYLKGHATGNPEFMKKAFHTEGKLIFIRDGKYSTRTFEEYIAGMSGKPAPDEAKRKRYIESVDVAGNAAIGKIILDYPSVRFVDYMTLLKIDGEWKIVNKSFYAEQKTAK